MFNIGPLELMVILIVALLVVGPQRLPEVGRSIGRGLREFRKAQEEVQRSLRLTLDDDDANGRPVRSARPKATPGTTRLPAAASTAGNGAGGPDRAGPSAESVPGGDATQEGAPTGQPTGQEIARTIGRGLAELRKAREELQQSFRVDIDDADARD